MDRCFLKMHSLFFKEERCVPRQEVIMLTGSIPKLLKEAGQVKEALEKIGPGLPDSIRWSHPWLASRTRVGSSRLESAIGTSFPSVFVCMRVIML